MRLGNAYLFFGCRKQCSDFIYRDEIAKYRGNHILEDAFIAFSRDDSSKKEYVQDLMKERRDLITEVLTEKKGYFYICGNTKMGLDV